MAKHRGLLVVEFETEGTVCPDVILQWTMDNFREAVLPSRTYNLVFSIATAEDVCDFVESMAIKEKKSQLPTELVPTIPVKE